MKTPPAPVPDGHKHCFKCGTTKPTTEFYPSRRSGRPSQAFDPWCKACRKAYYQAPKWKRFFVENQTKERAARRAYVTAIKTRSGCADCGEVHPACLEFHHVDPGQKVTEIVTLVDETAAMHRIDAEIRKCIVLCANCHRKRHYNEREAAKALAKEA